MRVRVLSQGDEERFLRLERHFRVALIITVMPFVVPIFAIYFIGRIAEVILEEGETVANRLAEWLALKILKGGRSK